MLSALAFSFNSCSDDDSSSNNNDNNNNGNNTEIGGTLTVTIDGAQKVFNTVIVNQELIDNDNFLTVTASINNSTSEIITFYVYENNLGADKANGFKYKLNNKEFDSMGINEDDFSITSIVEINSNNRLKGTFSGRLITNGYEVANFTNGTFDITFKD